MSMVLPSTVEEINCMQNLKSVHHIYVKENGQEFSNINAGRFKREVSLPNGVQWNVLDFDAYLNFEEPVLGGVEVNQSHEDRLVPGDEQRPRSESISSVASSMDDKSYVYNMPVKTFNTVCMDSGSRCITSDHSYGNMTTTVYQDLEAEETFQNLNTYLTQAPEIHSTDTTSSSISSAHSPLNDSNLEYSVLSNFSAISTNSQDSFSEKSLGLKRSATSLDDDVYVMSSSKRSCESPDDTRYMEVRRKNNAASKNCRKTRKEKQKEMETRVIDLEREKEDLLKQISYLEVMTNQLKKHISSILQPKSNV